MTDQNLHDHDNAQGADESEISVDETATMEENVVSSQDDDFSFDEGDSFYEEEGEDPVEYEETSFDEPKQKTSLNFFNIAIAGFVIIAAGAIGYNYFGSGQPATPQPVPQASQQQAPVANPFVEKQNSAPVETAINTGGMLANPEQLAEKSVETPPSTPFVQAEEAAAVIPSFDDTQIMDSLKQIDTILSEDSLPLPADEDNVAQIDQLPVAMDQDTPVVSPPPSPSYQDDIQDILQSPLPTETMAIEPVENIIDDSSDDTIVMVEQATAEPVPSASVQIDNNDVNQRLDQLNATLAQFMTDMETRLDHIAQKPAAPDSNQTDYAMTIDRLNRSIEALEKRVDGLARSQKKPSSQKISSVSKPKKATPSKVAKPKVKKATPPAPVIQKPKIQWVLRGVTADKAYVSPKGTQNLQTVTVGDTLEGIGQITSIAIENNRWVLRGTQGVVQQ